MARENSNTTKKPTGNSSHEKTGKPRNELFVRSMGQLATAAGQTISSERIALYGRALSDIGWTQLEFAFDLALKHCGEFIPSIAQLREYASRWKRPEIH